MGTKKEDVDAFLSGFKQKAKVFQIYFIRDRSKNLQTELELELKEFEKEKYLLDLAVENYYRGPSKDYDGGPDLWEFGKMIKGREVYIKITIGLNNKPVICISFHFPEKEIKYPFK
jgi:hypothetical protein